MLNTSACFGNTNETEKKCVIYRNSSPAGGKGLVLLIFVSTNLSGQICRRN